MSSAILAIEDDRAVRRSLEVMFRRWDDLSLEVAASGHEAIQKLNAGDYALVITDFRMPGLTGLELLEELRERFPALPLVVLSGAEEALTNSGAAGLGAVAYLRKPVRARELRSVVEEGIRTGVAKEIAAEGGE